MSENVGTMLDVKKFFEKDCPAAHLLTNTEFTAFWKSCSEEDKVAFKAAAFSALA